jgi:tRNA-modifying protein YgfZ
VTGEDSVSFLQGLITVDVKKVNPTTPLYGCMLTPQGKFLHDFFVVYGGDGVLYLTPELRRADDMVTRLSKLRLRSKVAITLNPQRHLYHSFDQGAFGDGTVFADPRHWAMGYYTLSDATYEDSTQAFTHYDKTRICLCIPDGSHDMIPEQAILLENHVDTWGGVDFTKGCYMGQELTARTKYRGLIKKHLYPMRVEGVPPTFDSALILDDKEIGRMRSSAGGFALGLLRDEMVTDGLILYGDNQSQLTVMKGFPSVA